MNLRQRFSTATAKFVSRYAAWILLGMVLASALAFPFARRLGLKANLIDLLPPDMPSVSQLNRLTNLVGGTSYLVVAIESADEETARAAAKAFSQRARAFEDVSAVDYRTDLSAFENSKLLFLTRGSLERIDGNIRDIIGYYRRKSNPFYIDLLDEEEPKLRTDHLELEERVNAVGSFDVKEGRMFMQVVLVKPAYPVSDFTRSEVLFRRTDEAFAEIQKETPEPFTFGLTGPYKTRYDEYQVILSDLKLTGFLTIALISVLMVAFFRKWRFVVLAFVSLGLGILWTCAFAELAIGYVNLISAFLLAILFGLGIDFAIHLLVTFEQERPRSESTEEALERTFALVGEPLITSALTTSIAFFSLTISQFQGFSHFGLIAGVGILACFSAIFLGLPSFIVMCEKMRQCSWAPLGRRHKWHQEQAGPIYAVLALGLLFTAFSVAQIPGIKFEYNFAKLQDKDSTSIALADRIGEYFGVVLNPVALVAPDGSRAFLLARKLNEYIETHPDTTFDFAASLFSHIPADQDEKIQVLSRIDERLSKREALMNSLAPEIQDQIAELRRQLRPRKLSVADIPRGMREQYEGAGGGASAVYIYPKSSLLDGQMAKRFVRELRSIDLPKDVTIAGEPVIYADILMLLEQDTPRAMLISLGMVVLMLFLHFRRLNHVLWAMAPVVLGFLWLAGLTGLFNFKFNYMNACILPSILGVGIDNGIHIFHRYKKERKSTVVEILEMTGKAVVMASVTTMAAFACLFLARHRGMASMGGLGLMGFLACLLTSVVFIPALIEFFELRYWHPFVRNQAKVN